MGRSLLMLSKTTYRTLFLFKVLDGFGVGRGSSVRTTRLTSSAIRHALIRVIHASATTCGNFETPPKTTTTKKQPLPHNVARTVARREGDMDHGMNNGNWNVI
jgi:hypothetical protein